LGNVLRVADPRSGSAGRRLRAAARGVRAGRIFVKNIACINGIWLYLLLGHTIATSGRCQMTVTYTGRVQGVGFRYLSRRVAAGFAVNGTVGNLPDGRVVLTAEGLREELEAFRAAIRNAGLAGFIRSEQVSWGSAQNKFSGFEIISLE